MSKKDATIFCLTPVRNEAWILDRFIRCAATWADHIIIADQRSTDSSREIARSHEKVTLVDNPGEFSEVDRQNLLIDTARSLPYSGRRVFIALDADEALSANWSTSRDWDTILEANPGSIFGFQWANILPDGEMAWLPPDEKRFCFIDDGSQHEPTLIHSPRLPEKPEHKRVLLDDIKILHFQYTDWQRMLSKQRWYQAWERINFPEKRPVQIFRQYNHMFAIPRHDIHRVKEVWFRAYEEAGIDVRSVARDATYWWDDEVKELIHKHGSETFRRIAIWDVTRNTSANDMDIGDGLNGISDVRSSSERCVHRWLQQTQPKTHTLPVRIIQKCLQAVGW